MKKQKYIIIFIIMSLAFVICGTLFRNHAIETPEPDNTSLVIANPLKETTKSIIEPNEEPKIEPKTETELEQVAVTDDSVEYKGMVISLGNLESIVHVLDATLHTIFIFENAFHQMHLDEFSTSAIFQYFQPFG